MEQLEREEDELCRELNEGIITQAQYNKAMRELHADYAAQARDSAQDAYDREIDRW